jgi:amino acid transporter
MTDQPRAQVPVVMLVIANAYRRCNMWNAHCGASFEWVGRAVSPYLGFVTGWLMIAGTLIGTLSPVVVLRPSILAVSGITPAGAWPDVVIATGVSVVMLLIAVAGIRLTARTQVTPGVIEYLILLPLAAAGFLAWVMACKPHHRPSCGRWPGSAPLVWCCSGLPGSACGRRSSPCPSKAIRRPGN